MSRPREAAPLRLERLTVRHAAAAFTCGEPAIDAFLRSEALAEQDLGLSSVTVAVDATTGAVAGYFTLSPLSIPLDAHLLQALGLPNVPYRGVGGYLLGRLGVATDRQGQGFGAALVVRALAAASQARAATAGAFLGVDPKTERLVAWYQALGFTRLDAKRRRVVRGLLRP